MYFFFFCLFRPRDLGLRGERVHARRRPRDPFAGMVTFYPQYCEKFGWMMDDGLLESMKAKNAEKLKELDDK